VGTGEGERGKGKGERERERVEALQLFYISREIVKSVRV